MKIVKQWLSEEKRAMGLDEEGFVVDMEKAQKQKNSGVDEESAYLNSRTGESFLQES